VTTGQADTIHIYTSTLTLISQLTNSPEVKSGEKENILIQTAPLFLTIFLAPSTLVFTEA